MAETCFFFDLDPEDGGIRTMGSVDEIVPDYTASHLKMKYPTYDAVHTVKYLNTDSETSLVQR
jgi:hypothetical protein